MTGYNPDKSATHQSYSIDAEKRSPHDGCFDGGHFKVHSKEDLDALVEVLHKLGYALQVTRITGTDILDEPFPSDKEDEPKP